MTSVNLVVLIPTFNEAAYIKYPLKSLALQSIKPDLVVLADNNSTDATVDEAERVLKGTDIELVVVRAPRDPIRGKLNIAIAYETASRVLSKLRIKAKYIATLEADVILEPNYYLKLINALSKSEKPCIAGGRLDPLAWPTGFPRDPFPLREPIHLWGANRLYTSSCWKLLESIAPFHSLPAWDTDHVVIAKRLGLDVIRVPEALSIALRPDNPPTPWQRGMIDALKGFPLWWVVLRFSRMLYQGHKYLAGYTYGKIHKRKLINMINKIIRDSYINGALEVVCSLLACNKSYNELTHG